MVSSWRASTWGDEITLEYGKALRDRDTTSGSVRVFGTNGPIGWTDVPLSDGPGVILGRKGATRGVEYSPGPFHVIDTAYYVVPKTDLDMRWLYYAIKFHRLGEIDDGSPIPSTTRSAVYVRDVDVPSLDEQRRIAHILGTLDDKIELNRRMNETLEGMARALFKSWFVDLDPVRAKAQGRDTGLPKHLADLFPDRLVDSEIGEIPEGWSSTTLGEIVREHRDGVNPLETPGEPFDHFSIPAFDAGRAPVRELGSAIRSLKYVIPKGAVLISKLNPERGRVWAPSPLGGARPVCSTEFVVLTPEAPVGRAWLESLLSSPTTRQTLSGLVTGTSKSHQRVQKGALFAVRVVLPERGVLSAFELKAQPWLQRIETSRALNSTLAQSRELLQRMLFCGEDEGA